MEQHHHISLGRTIVVQAALLWYLVSELSGMSLEQWEHPCPPLSLEVWQQQQAGGVRGPAFISCLHQVLEGTRRRL